MTNDELARLDREVLWHPFTQMRGWQDEDPVLIERAYGTTLVDTEGREYIDGVSSLWCNVHGHGHPHIDQAVHDQLDRVAHTTMLGLSHPGAARLGSMLLDVAPDGLSRVFYSDNGSTACEIALKMAFQYWQHRGEHARTNFVYLRNSYHGDTVGSVSVGGIDLFHHLYKPLLFEGFAVEPGDTDGLRALLDEHRDEIAAVIVEPLVQGAAGIVVQPEGFLRAVRHECDDHDLFMICDEVATGFGRTGTMFACEQEGVTPDFLTVAKGLTGGYLPLAATLTTERVYEGFLGEHHELKTFFHGHTYTGNPLACAAAIATLEVFDSERTIEQLRPKIEQLWTWLRELVEPLPYVAEVRGKGLMIGIELHGFAIEDRIGHQVTLAARRRGAIIRPLGDTIVLMPPLSTELGELRRLVEITAGAITEATGASQMPLAA
ncbi:MAG: adenosylmethionine--8-amino-7-oxononanoate transaminase [Solirubrobacteraceae bacterium]